MRFGFDGFLNVEVCFPARYLRGLPLPLTLRPSHSTSMGYGSLHMKRTAMLFFFLFFFRYSSGGAGHVYLNHSFVLHFSELGCLSFFLSFRIASLWAGLVGASMAWNGTKGIVRILYCTEVEYPSQCDSVRLEISISVSISIRIGEGRRRKGRGRLSSLLAHLYWLILDHYYYPDPDRV